MFCGRFFPIDTPRGFVKQNSTVLRGIEPRLAHTNPERGAKIKQGKARIENAAKVNIANRERNLFFETPNAYRRTSLFIQRLGICWIDSRIFLCII